VIKIINHVINAIKKLIIRQL